MDIENNIFNETLESNNESNVKDQYQSNNNKNPEIYY
jgi:hypothetical protein